MDGKTGIARLNRLTSLLAAIATLVGAASVVGAVLAILHLKLAQVSSVTIRGASQDEAQASNFRQLIKRLDKDEAAINGLSNSPPTNSALSAQLKELQSVVGNTSSQVAELDKAIMASPEKALEIPLLQRDLQNVKADDEAAIVALREEINRLYGLGEWFLGLMFTMAVGIISLAVSNFLPRIPAQKTPSE